MVDRETVEETAEHAKLDLSEEQKESFREDMEDILEAFDSIDSLDTEDVEPAFHPVDIDEEAREDEVEESLSNEEALSNSENTEEGYFKGPRAV